MQYLPLRPYPELQGFEHSPLLLIDVIREVAYLSCIQLRFFIEGRICAFLRIPIYISLVIPKSIAICAFELLYFTVVEAVSSIIPRIL